MNPLAGTSMPTFSRPISVVFGTDPTVISACEPRISLPSVSATTTSSPSRVTEAARDRLASTPPCGFEDVLDHRRRVGVLARQHPVPAGDQGDLDTHLDVRGGEFGAGDPRADHDQMIGQFGQGVDLSPGENPFPIRDCGVQHARVKRRSRSARRRPRATDSRRRSPVTTTRCSASPGAESASSARPSMSLTPSADQLGADVRGLGERQPGHPAVHGQHVDLHLLRRHVDAQLAGLADGRAGAGGRDERLARDTVVQDATAARRRRFRPR